MKKKCEKCKFRCDVNYCLYYSKFKDEIKICKAFLEDSKESKERK